MRTVARLLLGATSGAVGDRSKRKARVPGYQLIATSGAALVEVEPNTARGRDRERGQGDSYRSPRMRLSSRASIPGVRSASSSSPCKRE